MVKQGRKYCPKCRKIKKASQFYPHRTRSDGRNAVCKDCQKAIVKAYYEAHKEHYRKINKLKYAKRTKQNAQKTKTQINQSTSAI